MAEQTAAATTTGGAADVGLLARPRPNILLLMTDQHRADCIGAAGNPIIKTPNLDRIAREGVRFDRAYSSTPTCVPARAALLTGQSPWQHGMLGFWKIAERYPVEMPRAIREAGYYTHAVGWLHYHPPRNLHGFHDGLIDIETLAGNDRGFSDYHKWLAERAPGVDPERQGLDLNDYRTRPSTIPEELHRTTWTGRAAVDFINGYARTEPFFLKVSFTRPHSPYDPPQRFLDMYRPEDMPAPHVAQWAAKYAPLQGDPPPPDMWHGDVGLEQVRRSRQGYYASTTFVDEQIGHILKALETRGMLENTLILFTCDHGDMLGDQHLWRKSYPYEGSARISMLVRCPRSMGMDDCRGRVLHQPVELRDVLPTFLDVAGRPIPAVLDGASLLPLVRGQTNGWRRHIDLEHDICYDPRNHWNALADERWKYIFHAVDGSEQLFDLQNDPGELSDLAADGRYANVLAHWRQSMVEHLSPRGEPFVKDGRLLARPKGMLLSPNYPGDRPA